MDERTMRLTEFVSKENELGLFELTVDGIVAYGFLCRELRQKYLAYRIPSVDKDKIITKKKSSRLYTILSYLQLLRLKFFGNSIDNFVYSFFRVDKVGDFFMDKFTDPLIDSSTIGNSYIIFEKSKDFEHKSPRIHKSKIIYTDYIEQKAIRYAQKNKASFIATHNNELEQLWTKLDLLMSDVPYSKEWTVIRLLRDKSMMDFYKKFFKKHNIKRFLAPCRAVFLPQMYVCKELGIPVMELQHGLLAGMGGVTYVGNKDRHFVPDYFLSFGDLYHKERYGVEQSKVVNIGWALSDYIKRTVPIKDLTTNCVLVISSNKINPLFKLVGLLAQDNSSIEFHIRLHPLETMTEFANQVVENHSNVSIQDNSKNISVVLPRYKMVIGDNSTVLVEALGLGKKVGRISYGEIQPKYFCEEEKDLEWIISDCASFKTFLESMPKENKDLRFYSNYNREVLESLLI